MNVLPMEKIDLGGAASRPWTDPLMWSNLPLFFFAAGWLARGHAAMGLCLGLSAALSALYHGSFEGDRWAAADEAWAYVALATSLGTLRGSLAAKPCWQAAAYAGALCLDLAVSTAIFVKAKPLRATRTSSTAYSDWHSAWHLAVVVGQGILFLAGA